MSTALLWDERFGTHDMGEAAIFVPPGGLVEPDRHIDNPARIVRTRNLVRAAGLDDELVLASPREASADEVARVHSEEHLERMRATAARGGGDAGGGYTPMDGRSYGLALLSAGSALRALEVVMDGRATNAHAMLRRSGHHASRDTGYGFCVFNNCAVVARAAQRDHGLGRVAVVDIDAHHGNGTEAIFYEDPSVLTISIHQDRSFPVDTGGLEAVGAGDGTGANLNVNLPAGTGDGGFLDAVERIVQPTLDAFGPELIVVACGVDASPYDPLAQLAVTAAGFAAVGDRLRETAERCCDGRLVSAQEGGYSHQYAPFCWLALIEALAARPERHPDPFAPFLEGCAFVALTDEQRAANDATLRVAERQRPGA
jgi:acetoin utilization deacetylase AcuC-like enzyme